MNDKRNVTVISIILAVVATVLFIVLGVTGISVVAYIFALLGIAGLLVTTFMMLDKKDAYPWMIAIPSSALTYLIIELIVSLIFIILEQMNVWKMPVPWLLIIHIIILCIFAVRIILMRGGLSHIEATTNKIKASTSFVQSMRLESERLVDKANDVELKNELKRLSDKIRYSDPISNDGLSDQENNILLSMQHLKETLGNAPSDNVRKLVSDISAMIDERNKRCKMMK